MTPRRALLVVATLSLLPAAPAQPGRGPRGDQPGPWDHDVHVYRVPTDGVPLLLAKFERAGVATAARLADGRLVIAHQHFPADAPADFDKVAVHFSRDEGRTWTEAQVIRVHGLPDGMRFPFDPTLVPLPDGRVRLYFTSRRLQRPDLPAIYSAISENAIDFTVEPGVRFAIDGRGVIDCAVALHRGEFHLFAPDNGRGDMTARQREPRDPAERPREGGAYHATSEDGLTFERRADIAIAGRRRWLGDAKSDGRVITFHGTGEGGVWSATSAGGEVWTLARTITGLAAADPGTVRLKDGSLLVAGTAPPRPGTPGAKRRPPK